MSTLIGHTMSEPADPTEARAASLAAAGDVLAQRYLEALARVRELEGVIERDRGVILDAAINAITLREYQRELPLAKDRARVAEARVRELEGVIERVIDAHDEDTDLGARVNEAARAIGLPDGSGGD